ncbi:MAG: alpha-amylase family protein [Candidatus Omnitrophota bacterium]
MKRSKDWLASGMVVIGCWESLMVSRRWGVEDPASLKEYEMAHEEETIKKLARNGFNFFITHYHKGFGWKTERQERERVKEQVNLCHKYGMKIAVYFRVDNIIGETFYQEMPEAKEWVARNERGEKVPVCGSSWRHRICFNESAYRTYAKKVIQYAVKELGVDAIHFDGMAGMDEASICKCTRCSEGFKKFLLERWGKRRKEFALYFGHRNIEGVEIPTWEPGVTIAGINNVMFLQGILIAPDVQEWIRYKCFLFADFHRELSDYLHRLDPNVVMCINSGIFSWTNTSAYFGVYLPLLAGRNDIVFSEDGHLPAVREKGILCHRIRDYKIADSIGQSVIAYNHPYPSHGKESPYDRKRFCLSVAESLAFNRGNSGHLGFLKGALRMIDDKHMSETLHHITGWRKNHTDIFSNVVSNAEVAILRNFSSMAFDTRTAHRHVMLIEQMLIQKQIPFDILFDENLKRKLPGYHLLVLANQTCLSTDIMDEIAGFVRAGGNLLVTGRSGERNENSRCYPENLLMKKLMLIFKYTENARFENVLGGGKVAYVPDVVPEVKEENWFPNWRFDSDANRYFIRGQNPARNWAEYPFCNWALPKNSVQILKAIKWAGNLSLTIRAPESVAVNWTSAVHGSKEYLHLVNYDNRNTVSTVKIFIPQDKYRKCTFFFFDTEPDRICLEVKGHEISVPAFQTYAVGELIPNQIDSQSLYPLLQRGNEGD